METVRIGNWIMSMLEDDDGHLQFFIKREGDSIPIETDSSGMLDNELMIRFTTPEIEYAYREEQGIPHE